MILFNSPICLGVNERSPTRWATNGTMLPPVTRFSKTSKWLALISSRETAAEYLAGRVSLRATNPFSASLFNRVWTLLGLPCLALPVALGPRGLPLAAQLVGRWQGDEDLVAAARHLQPHTRYAIEAPAAG